MKTETALARLMTAIEKANRYPAGAQGGKGGQFAPKDDGGGAGGGSKAQGSLWDDLGPEFGGSGGAKPQWAKDFDWKPESKGGGYGGGGAKAKPGFGWKDGFGDHGGSKGSGYSKPNTPKTPPAGALPHPKTNDKGQPVTVNYPTKPSGEDTWTDPNASAVFTPGSKAPASLHGVAMSEWKEAPTTIEGWAAVAGQIPELDEQAPPPRIAGKSIGSGVVIQEPDGRIWLTKPTNEFGGYKSTFPKGTLEDGLSLQAGAIKEAYEETGLQVEITGVLGDFERSTSVARYYFARRIGGTPKDMGWESQAMVLAPPKALNTHLNMPVDRGIAERIELYNLVGSVNALVRKSGSPKSLYISRKLLNAAEIIAWAKSQGFTKTLPAEDMHVTVLYSRSPVDWFTMDASGAEEILIHAGGPRAVERFGKGDCSVLRFASSSLALDHRIYREQGASSDWPDYAPHVTLSFDPAAPAPETVEPYTGRLHFGPEIWEELDEDWKRTVVEKAAGKGSYDAQQARWPAGSPLGGQWKAIGADGLSSPPKIASNSNPQYAKQAQAAYSLAKSGDLTALGAFVASQSEKVKADKDAGKKTMHVKWKAQVLQYATDLLATKLKGPVLEATAVRATGPAKLSEFTKTGGKPGGSNPGGLYKDGKGKTWLIKGNLKLQQKAVTQAQSDARANNEVLAAKLLTAAGAGAPVMKLVDLGGEYGGGLGVASLMVDGVVPMSPTNKGHISAIRKDYAVNAWLGNYDVLGMGYDNTVIKDGAAVNIDPGGALLFRAQGLPKDGFAADAPEWETMRTTTGEQKAVYGGMTASELKESAAKLQMITDDTIRELVKTYGDGLEVPGGGKLDDVLIARKQAILIKAGLITAPAEKPKAKKTPQVPPMAGMAPIGADPTNGGYSPEAAKVDPKNVKAEALGVIQHLYNTMQTDGFYAQLSAYSDHPALKDHPEIVAEIQSFAHGLIANKGATAKTSYTLEEAKAAVDPAIAPLDMTYLSDDAAGFAAAYEAAVTNPAFADHPEVLAEVKAYIATLTDPPMVPNTAPAEVNYKDLTEAQSNGLAQLMTAPPVLDPKLKELGQKIQDSIAANQVSPLVLAVKETMKLQEKGDPLSEDPQFKGLHDYATKMVLLSSVLNAGKMPPVAGATPLGQELKAEYDAIMAGEAPAKERAPTSDVKAEAAAPTIKPAAPAFADAMLPETNVNAASVNKKIAAIQAAFEAGNPDAILALGFGSNNYAAKQIKLANDALAALGSQWAVSTSQKPNTHPGIGSGGAAKPAEAKPAEPAPAAPKTKADPKAKPKPSLADLKSSDLPAVPDVMNLKGPGNPYSSKQWKNEANIEILQQVRTAALAGGPDAIDAIQFPELNPETGAPTGNMLPLEKHPAANLVQNYVSQVKLAIEEFRNPPEPMKEFSARTVKSALDAANKFTGPPVVSKKSALPANQKIGFWLALGKVENAADILASSTGQMTKAMHANFWKAYQGYSAMTRTFISYVQGSGSANDAYREGKSTYNGTSTVAMAKAAYQDATPLGADMTLYRWQHMSNDMVKQLLDAEPGTVIDSLGSMCTSYHPTATNHFGNHQIIIRSGSHGQSKALMSFGSGSFTGEREITTLPGQRYALKSVTKNSSGKLQVELVMLPSTEPDFGKDITSAAAQKKVTAPATAAATTPASYEMVAEKKW